MPQAKKVVSRVEALRRELHASRKSIRLNDLKKFQDSRAWKNIAYRPNFHQTSIPVGKNTAQAIGIAPKSKVLVFAGYAGDWARALAENCEVHYTDASKEVVSKIKEWNPGKIKSFKAVPSHLKPQRPNVYDWTFSYEPYPVQQTEREFKLTLARGLLNKKGLKLVYSGGVAVGVSKELIALAEVYGAKVVSEYATIERQGGRKVEPFAVGVTTLLTNTHARKMMWLDLRMLNLMEKRKIGMDIPDRKDLRKAFKVTDEELTQSAARVRFLFLK